MDRDHSIYIDHILQSINSIIQYIQSINSIIQYTNNLSKEDFLKEPMVQDAVIRQLEIIGEATKKIPMSYRSEYPNIPWEEMAGMRDKLIHDYLGVDVAIVWETVKQDIPLLHIEIQKCI